jgi:hypothetical protein
VYEKKTAEDMTEAFIPNCKFAAPLLHTKSMQLIHIALRTKQSITIKVRSELSAIVNHHVLKHLSEEANSMKQVSFVRSLQLLSLSTIPRLL